jgi:hypothetical protein
VAGRPDLPTRGQREIRRNSSQRRDLRFKQSDAVAKRRRRAENERSRRDKNPMTVLP